MSVFVQKRLIIYVKDIEIITGLKSRTARRMMQKIREIEGKSKEQLVTVAEFCNYTHLKEEEVFKSMGY